MQIESANLPAKTMESNGQKRPKKGTSRTKKVAVTIGHDLLGNPIVTYRKPYEKVVHLPQHIQTPELLQTTHPTAIPAKPTPSPQSIITNTSAQMEAATNTNANRTTLIRPQTVRAQNIPSINQSSMYETESQPYYVHKIMR